ncbi:MAG: hypothetical protein LBF55_03585, partial [Prevotellaceae bacterium]|nr:hypothetical protein [Prevotellaceae bacterium]
MKNLLLKNLKKLAFLALLALGCLCARAQTEAQIQESDSTASSILPPVDMAEAVIQVANFSDMFQDTTGIFFRRLREFHKTTGYKLEVGAYLSGIQKSSFWSNMVQILFSSTNNAQDGTIQGNAVNIDVGWKIGGDGRLEGKMRQSVSNLSGNIMPEALQMFRDS